MIQRWQVFIVEHRLAGDLSSQSYPMSERSARELYASYRDLKRMTVELQARVDGKWATVEMKGDGMDPFRWDHAKVKLAERPKQRRKAKRKEVANG